MEQEIKVEQPTLIHFIEKIVELTKLGYVPSKTNQGAPQSWGLGLFTCGMVLENPQVEKQSEETPEVVPTKRPTQTRQKSRSKTL